MKKTVIIGASDNPSRYAQIALGMLKDYQQPVVPMGIHGGEFQGEPILDVKARHRVEDEDTVMLDFAPRNQKEWYDYILSLEPKRTILNPGTEKSDQME